MTYLTGDEKPSLDDLEHHGVKGMHWGQRKARATGPEIRTARSKVHLEADKVRQQAKKAKQAAGTKSASRENAKLSKMKVDFLNNPDRATAARMTRGEKFASILLTGVASPLTVVSVGAIAGSSARARTIEKRQQTGYYNKKP